MAEPNQPNAGAGEGAAGVKPPATLLNQPDAANTDAGKGEGDAAAKAAAEKAASDKAAADVAAAKAKGDEPAKKDDAKPVVPEKYAFQAPEGMGLNEARLAEFSAFAKELGLTQEQFDKAAPIAVGLVQDAIAQQAQLLWERDAQWVAKSKADPEIGGIGGAALKENLGLATTGAEAWFGKEVAGLFDSSVIGSHPDLLKGLIRLGRLASDDNFDVKTGRFERKPANAMEEQEDRALRMYNADGSKKE